VVATHLLADEQVTDSADSPPKETVVAPGAVLKPLPWMVTVVEASSGPLEGESLLSVVAADAVELSRPIQRGTANDASRTERRDERPMDDPP
jgi:hypothetical protein